MTISGKKPPLWLPITRDEMLHRGWNEVDVVLITGDAYVDHPSFGTAVVSRVIEKEGLRVAIVPQPNWQDDLRDFRKFGKPKLFFGVASGNMDSMVNHYTANKRLRSDDAFTPGGNAGFRPDYAAYVYTRICKQLYPDVPVVLGGIEASLRRLTHYDYWSNSLKPSILTDTGADLLIYGMGERPLVALLNELKSGKPFAELTNIPQTAYLTENKTVAQNFHESIELPAHEVCVKDKKAFALAFRLTEQESNRWQVKHILQAVGEKVVAVNPPFPPMEETELDAVYDLPFTRLPHPKYAKRGTIPAYEMIRHSVNIHRGCFGGCSFCTISAHQGKFITSRSEASVLREAEAITRMPDFKGYITDLGGPSANMYRMKGFDTALCKKCGRASCIFPSVCKNLNFDHQPLTALYRKVAVLPQIKKVTIGSGIRYDLLAGKSDEENRRFGLREYTRQVIVHHVSGRLKVAPEHTADSVLQIMRKPSFRLFHDFKKQFDAINRENGLNQQLIPYFISSHPGCSLENMAELAVETKTLGYKLEQVQDLTPTPMTLASVMYYTGLDPYTIKPVYVAKNREDKLNQQRFFFWYKPENKAWIRATLKKLRKEELLRKLF